MHPRGCVAGAVPAMARLTLLPAADGSVPHTPPGGTGRGRRCPAIVDDRFPGGAADPTESDSPMPNLPPGTARSRAPGNADLPAR